MWFGPPPPAPPQGPGFTVPPGPSYGVPPGPTYGGPAQPAPLYGTWRPIDIPETFPKADPNRPFVPGAPVTPDLDDVARRTSKRSILANLSGTILVSLYLAFRFEVEGNRPSRTGATLVPQWVVIAAVLPVASVLFGIAFLRWRAFTFRVNEHRIVVDKGVLTRHHQVIPFDRVQQVDINRKLTALVLGLSEVRIDTAGSGNETSVKLRYLAPQEADALRSFILYHRDLRRSHAQAAGVGAATAAATGASAYPGAPIPATGPTHLPLPPEHTLVTLSPKQLIVGALTHNSVVALVPIAVLVAVWTGSFMALASNRPATSAAWVGGGLLTLVILLFLVAQTLVSTVVRHWGFSLSHQGDDLHLRFGLTDQRHLTVPRRRIQHVEVMDNPLRRAFGLVDVHLHSAAATGGGGEGKAATKFEIPVLRKADLAVVLPLLLGDPHWHIPTLAPRPIAAKNRAIRRRVLVLLLAASLPAITFRPMGLALFLLAFAGIPWGLAAHRRAGSAITPSVAVLSHGVIHHRTALVPRPKIQSARTTASPFQRMARLQTLHLDVARSALAPHLFDIDCNLADDLRHQVMTAPTKRPAPVRTGSPTVPV